MLYPDFKELIRLKSLFKYRAIAAGKTQNLMQGDYASIFHGLGVEFETVRPYVIGDDVRYIDWRVTARIGKPQVKTFRAESDRNVLIIVDANAYTRFGTRGTFKSILAAKAAALLCWKSLQQQDRVGGLVYGDIDKGLQYFMPSKAEATVLQFFKALCNTNINVNAPVTTTTALDHLARLVRPNSLVFIISDFSQEPIFSLQKSLMNLRKKCKLVMLPLTDPSDSDIPEFGSAIFTNNDQQLLIDTNNSQARKKYSSAWQNYRISLIHICKKLNIPILWLETAVDPVKSMFVNAGSIPTWKN